MLINQIRPGAQLAAHVRCYRIIDFHFPSDIAIHPKLYSPRPEHCLQFYPRDTEQVEYGPDGVKISGKRVVLSGQHTCVQKRQIGSHFLSVQVIFQPTSLYKLLRIPARLLTNLYADAEDFLGKDLQGINEELFYATGYSQMISIVESYLIRVLHRIKTPSAREQAMDACALSMLHSEENFKMDKFLRESYLSHRQFDRLFTEQIGVPPKQYLQLIRFDKTYRLKNRRPEMDWLSIAVQNGYHDYQHLAKEYKNFTGHSPARFFQLDQSAPERSFGDAEI